MPFVGVDVVGVDVVVVDVVVAAATAVVADSFPQVFLLPFFFQPVSPQIP